MLSAFLDSRLARLAARRGVAAPAGSLATRAIETPVGAVRVFDSAAGGAAQDSCVIFVPDGPNVIEHYEELIGLLSRQLRVVCFDMPGFGQSPPRADYGHSLDQGAAALLGVMDALAIGRATLAFSCANGFYALRASQRAPARIAGLVLSQTPSLTAMRAWTRRVVPWPLRVPLFGQLAIWFARRKAAKGWYPIALPRGTSPSLFQQKALDTLDAGGCFCLAGIVQGLARERLNALVGVAVPCTLVWGDKDHSHKYTDPASLLQFAARAEIVRFDDCGHFPDIEQPARYAALLLERVARYG